MSHFITHVPFSGFVGFFFMGFLFLFVALFSSREESLNLGEKICHLLFFLGFLNTRLESFLEMMQIGETRVQTDADNISDGSHWMLLPARYWVRQCLHTSSCHQSSPEPLRAALCLPDHESTQNVLLLVRRIRNYLLNEESWFGNGRQGHYFLKSCFPCLLLNNMGWGFFVCLFWGAFLDV